MNETKVKTVFEERDEAIRLLNRTSLELNKTKAKLAATEEALAQVQRESAELREERDEMRRLTIEECAKIAKKALDERSFGPLPRIGSVVAERILALAQDGGEQGTASASTETAAG